MKSSFSAAAKRRFPWALLLGCIVLLASGCATLSKPTIGIGGTNDNLPRAGRP